MKLLPFNAAHLKAGMLPLKPESAFFAKETIDEKLQEGLLEVSRGKSFWAYKQTFHVQGGTKTLSRQGLIALIDITQTKLLEHENVIEEQVEKLSTLFKNNFYQSLPVTCFYTSPQVAEKEILDKVLNEPTFVFETFGVTHYFTAINDKILIEKLAKAMESHRIFIADGHHRYNALKQTQEVGKKQLLSFIFNTVDNPVEIYPYHRLYFNENFDKKVFLDKLKLYFTVKECASDYKIKEKGNFKLVFNNNTYHLSFIAGINKIPWNFSKIIKDQDLTILHYFIFEKILGIKGQEQKKSKNIKFCSIFTDYIEAVRQGDADFAIVTRGIELEDLKQVAESDYTFPQKSTFFYPKLLSGFLFVSNSI